MTNANTSTLRLAFTLVELLITVAIIALLAALLLPCLTLATARAKSVQCLSQLHQLGIAMQVYSSDNHGFLPAAHAVVPWDSTNPVAWSRVLFPQKSAPDFLACPSYSTVYNKSHFNYFMGARAAFVDAGAQPASLPLPRVMLPSQYILSGDCNFAFQAIDADPDNYTADTLFGSPPAGHGHQVNILYGDSHAAKAKRFEPDSMTFSFTDSGKYWDQVGN